MAFAQYDLAPQGTALGKSVLTLSCLGIFSKLLGIDLSNAEFLGVTFGKAQAELIPGLIGLVLIYALGALTLARTESAFLQATDDHTKKTHQEILKKPALKIGALLLAPLSIVVYSMPFALGCFTVHLLWSDSIEVLKRIWSLTP